MLKYTVKLHAIVFRVEIRHFVFHDTLIFGKQFIGKASKFIDYLSISIFSQ